MAKAKKGDLLSCELCGLVVVVDDVVGISMAELICCKEPMAKGKAAAEKAKKKATLKLKAPKAVAIKKEVKTAVKAVPVKAKAIAKKVVKPAIAKAPAKKAAAPKKKETKAKK
ncbi:MAG: hypothetical protein WCJ37_11415 [Syntrophus sp. (in: bacteria)]